MKKSFCLFVLGLILFIGCLVKVNAANAFVNNEIFLHDWDTTVQDMDNIGIIFFENNVEYKYGFVVSDINIDETGEEVTTKLYRYSANGKVVNEKEYLMSYFPIMETEGENIYALMISQLNESEEVSIDIVKINSDMVVESKYSILNLEDVVDSLYDVVILGKAYGLDVVSTDSKGNVYVFTYDGIIAVGPDYAEAQLLQDYQLVNEYYSWFNYLGSLSVNYHVYVSTDNKSEYNVYSGARDLNSCNVSLTPVVQLAGISDVGEGTCVSDEVGVITLYKNNEVVWNESYFGYTSIINVKFIDEYIVAIGINDDVSEVIVLDMNGEIKQKIQLSESYIFLDNGAKNFMVTAISPTNDPTCIEEFGLINGIDTLGINDVGFMQGTSCYTYKNEVWYIPLVVETKTDGNGTVTAVESSRYGEDVTFTVTPNEGFVLGEVRVTDENGNVVTFNDYTFTMPNANVLIDVTFLPDNSDTSDFTIVILVSIATIASIVFLINKRKIELMR